MEECGWHEVMMNEALQVVCARSGHNWVEFGMNGERFLWSGKQTANI